MQSSLSDYIRESDYQKSAISDIFTPYHNNQVIRLLNEGINDQAISRQEVIGISIDGAESKDLDDAIYAERTKKGYCLWVHIADVAEVVEIFSPIDLEALKRTTSIYGKDEVIPMIPFELSNGMLSLDTNGDEERKLTMTLQMELDRQ